MTQQRLRGVIVKGVGGLYYARDEAGEVHVLRARGVFRKRHITPLVGDRIELIPGTGDEHGWVEDILPRESVFVRPPVANVRHLVLVFAPQPTPDMLVMDMLLVTACAQHIAPILVVNKCELDSSLGAKIREEYAALGAPVYEVSAKTGQGLDALAEALRDGICCLAGQSGVGKSTLLSTITGIELETGEISRRIARGKNTTRHAELMEKNGFQVLDTPGFSLLELWNGLEPLQLKAYYPEFAPYEESCRFQPCYHLSEPGCAVLEAAREGALSQARVDRYH
ncbi:MAG: ribosome small subunit-dependent GTPase A, partial [Eubacteriales bacterium]|nr:ribosome small subunit-dependent GTPase A [Eubacteriales bacterium]